LADKTLHSDFDVPFNTRRKLDDAGGRTAGVIAAALSSGPSSHMGETSSFPSYDNKLHLFFKWDETYLGFDFTNRPLREFSY
jgi:hypothetical protein